MIIPEDVYQEFHKQTFYQKHGVYPKAIKSFDKQKKKDDWIYFERFSQRVNDGNGVVDYKKMIEILAKYHKGWFKPSMLISMKGIKIYKTYIESESVTTNANDIYTNILKSIKFIKQFCEENNLKTFNEYINHNADFFPTLLLHMSAGSINKYFVAIIPDIDLILRNYPKDCVNEFAIDFLKEYKALYLKCLSIKKMHAIMDNLFMIIDKTIQKNLDEKKCK